MSAADVQIPAHRAHLRAARNPELGPVGTPLANCPTYAGPVVDMGSCPPPNFNQPRAVVGFVRVALLCVKRNGKADLPDCDPGFTGAEIKFAMSCGGISGAAAGCASLGYSARTCRLVQ